MNFFFLFLVFVPYVSIPPFVHSSSYVQPFSIVISWVYLIYRHKIKLPLSPFKYTLFFLFFVFLSFFVPLSPFALDLSQGYSIFFAYAIGIIQYILLTVLFLHALRDGSGKLFDILTFCLLSIPLITLLSICMDYIYPGTFNLFKSKIDFVADGLSFSSMYRGRSGLLPEPSYSGLVLSASLLCSFYLFSAKKALAEYCTFKSFRSFYSSSFSSFFSRRIVIVSLTCSIFAFFLGLSVSSFIAFFFLSALLFLPLISPSLFFLLCSKRFISIFFVGVLAAVLIFQFSGALPSGSRMLSVFKYFDIYNFQSTFTQLFLFDQSGADRFNSIFLGVYPLFKFPPVGLGLGSFENFFIECSEPVISAFQLMCGTEFNSTRNHNAFANFSQDYGVFGLFFIVLLPFSFVPVRLASVPKVLLLLFPFMIFIFIILPSPLGAPTSWSVYASATVLLLSVDRVSRFSVN